MGFAEMRAGPAPAFSSDFSGKSLLPGASVFPFVRWMGRTHPVASNVWFAER